MSKPQICLYIILAGPEGIEPSTFPKRYVLTPLRVSPYGARASKSLDLSLTGKVRRSALLSYGPVLSIDKDLVIFSFLFGSIYSLHPRETRSRFIIRLLWKTDYLTFSRFFRSLFANIRVCSTMNLFFCLLNIIWLNLKSEFV